ncbi:MAG: hypothetical protein H6978_08890 [Gammaproteobacteria bacterium]|nr:hypothetical protein [Gammaproteobacteria bacterium]
MSKPHIPQVIAACAALAIANAAAASIVADTLPFSGTPDWTDVTFSGTSMSLINGGTASRLSTANGAGVWFGWGASPPYSNTPAWMPGDDASGNHLVIEASFSEDAADWSTYFFDTTYSVSFLFAPTGCNGNAGSCYGVDGQSGVTISTPVGGTFISLDLTVPHTYEFLLKDGLVQYAIDGQSVYAGVANQSNAAAPLLVIGDGSGSTQTGRGSMTIYSIAFDNAPDANVSPVPVPAALPLLGSAVGLLMVRRRRSR